MPMIQSPIATPPPLTHLIRGRGNPRQITPTYTVLINISDRNMLGFKSARAWQLIFNIIFDISL